MPTACKHCRNPDRELWESDCAYPLDEDWDPPCFKEEQGKLDRDVNIAVLLPVGVLAAAVAGGLTYWLV